MIAIGDVNKYKQRREMQQEEANAALSVAPQTQVKESAPVVPEPLPAVATPDASSTPSPVPASAIDTGAPVATKADNAQPKPTVPPVIPTLAVAPSGPTSPINEKPIGVAISNPTETKLVGGLSDITTETFEQAMARGKYTPAQWLHENEKAAREGRRPPLTMEDYLRVIKYGDLNENPEQKAKRERREQISQAISGIGNVIANAANLAFAAKGAVPIDLNSGARYENERMQRIKEKRDALKEKADALFLNAKQDEIRYARDLEAARVKAAIDREEKEYNRAKDKQKFEYQKGRDDRDYELKKSNYEAANKNRENVSAENARHNKAMEGISWTNAKTTAERARQAANKSANDKKFDYVIADNMTFPFPKDMSKAQFAVLYQAIKRDPNLKGGALENVDVKLGEGGDSDSKMMNIVRRRTGDSPEAIKYLKELFGIQQPEENKTYTNPFSAPWDSFSNNWPLKENKSVNGGWSLK